MVANQSAKSPEVMTKSADVLRKHGLERESKLLSGKHLSLLAACLKPSDHITPALYVTYTLLGHSE